MNKKQLVVAWGMGILSSILLLRLYGRTYLRLLGVYSEAHWRPGVWPRLAVVLIIGGLLIYTLRDKKK